MADDKELWVLYASVISSNNKVKILKVLGKAPMTPKQISDITLVSLSTVSKTLKKLRENNIVTCVTPNRKKGRLYALTIKGSWILDKLNKVGGIKKSEQ